MDKTEMLTKIYEVIQGSQRIEVHHYYNKITNEAKAEYVTVIGIWIGDVLDWIKYKDEHLFMHNAPSYVFDKCYRLLFTLWHKLCLPIDQQSDECIKYVYDLLPPSSSNDQ